MFIEYTSGGGIYLWIPPMGSTFGANRSRADDRLFGGASLGTPMAVRIASIGLGGLAHVLLDVLAEVEGVEVAAAVDVSRPAREEFEAAFDRPAYQDHQELLAAQADELDAALVVTPHVFHFAGTAACLDAGLHVLVEKPMVVDVQDAAELVELAAERDLVLQVGYQRHFHPVYREMKRIVDSGRIGEPHAVSCHLGQSWIDLQSGTWRTDPELSGGGQLYDTGSHLLDAMLWTAGATPKTVAAQMTYADPGVDVNSALAMILERDGRPMTASASISGDGISMEPKEGYAVWGTDGRLSYTEGVLYVTEGDSVRYRTEITDGIDFRTLTRKKLQNFVDAIRGDAESAVPGEYGLEVTALTEAAYRAAETGTTVDVDEFVDAVLRGDL